MFHNFLYFSCPVQTEEKETLETRVFHAAENKTRQEGPEKIGIFRLSIQEILDNLHRNPYESYRPITTIQCKIWDYCLEEFENEMSEITRLVLIDTYTRRMV